MPILTHFISPTSIEFNVKDQPFTPFISDWKGVTELTIIADMHLQYIYDLPPNCTHLTIYATGLTHITDLPNTLTSLAIRQSKVLTTLPNFPNSLISIEINRCTSIKKLPKLSDNLQMLNIVGCSQLAYIPKLPHTLRRVFANNSGLLVVPKTENEWKNIHIDISNTPLQIQLKKICPIPTNNNDSSNYSIMIEIYNIISNNNFNVMSIKCRNQIRALIIERYFKLHKRADFMPSTHGITVNVLMSRNYTAEEKLAAEAMVECMSVVKN